MVLSYKKDLANSSGLSATLAANFNKLEVTDIKNGSLDEETFFGGREKSLLEDAAPASKIALNLGYETKGFNINLATTSFGKVSYFSFDNTTPVNYDSKIVLDLTATAKLSNNLNFTLGLNNIFNEYPTQQSAFDDTDSSAYWDAVQMGFAGSFYYARVGFNF